MPVGNVGSVYLRNFADLEIERAIEIETREPVGLC